MKKQIPLHKFEFSRYIKSGQSFDFTEKRASALN